MASKNRETIITIEDELLTNGRRYSYFQTIRLLRFFLRKERDTFLKIHVRPKLSLDFPVSDIDVITVQENGGYQITANFFGLYGVDSPLPAYYTEDLLDEEREGGQVTRDFIDIAHAVTYPLLFQAWEKYRLQQRIIENEDTAVLNFLYAFIGLDRPELRRALLPDSAILLRYAGLLNQQPRSALGLQTILADRFQDIRVEVDCCILQQQRIPADQCLCLGHQAHQLGRTTYLGCMIDDYGGNLRIRLSEVSQQRFHHLLPGSEGYRHIQFLCRFYLNTPLHILVEINLQRHIVETTCLGQLEWSLLGLDTWLCSKDNAQPACMTFILPETDLYADENHPKALLLG